jgi:hypothetical protein
MANYFNTLSLRDQLAQLGQCEFMHASEFSDGVSALKGKKLENHLFAHFILLYPFSAVCDPK